MLNLLREALGVAPSVKSLRFMMEALPESPITRQIMGRVMGLSSQEPMALQAASSVEHLVASGKTYLGNGRNLTRYTDGTMQVDGGWIVGGAHGVPGTMPDLRAAVDAHRSFIRDLRGQNFSAETFSILPDGSLTAKGHYPWSEVSSNGGYTGFTNLYKAKESVNPIEALPTITQPGHKFELLENVMGLRGGAFDKNVTRMSEGFFSRNGDKFQVLENPAGLQGPGSPIAEVRSASHHMVEYAQPTKLAFKDKLFDDVLAVAVGGDGIAAKSMLVRGESAAKMRIEPLIDPFVR